MPERTMEGNAKDLPLLCEHMKAGYDGEAYLQSLSLTVNAGEIVGLIGANGAGKSTTLKTILGVLPLMDGEVIVNGIPVNRQPEPAKQLLGYIPETPDLYQELTLWEYLRFMARIYNMPAQKWENEAERLLSDFNMSEVKDRFPGTFSKGMRQKVMVIAALLHHPNLYLIDEPYIGLDPLSIVTLTDWLNRERERGAGVLMSTHVLDAAENLCDRFYILHKGRLVAAGTLDDLREQTGLLQARLLDIYADVVTRYES